MLKILNVYRNGNGKVSIDFEADGDKVTAEVNLTTQARKIERALNSLLLDSEQSHVAEAVAHERLYGGVKK